MIGGFQFAVWPVVRVGFMQEKLEQPDDPLVMDFDAWKTDRADGDGQSDSLKQGKVHMNIERLRLEAGEVAGDDLEPFTDGVVRFSMRRCTGKT